MLVSRAGITNDRAPTQTMQLTPADKQPTLASDHPYIKSLQQCQAALKTCKFTALCAACCHVLERTHFGRRVTINERTGQSCMGKSWLTRLLQLILNCVKSVVNRLCAATKRYTHMSDNYRGYVIVLQHACRCCHCLLQLLTLCFSTDTSKRNKQ